MTSPATFDYNCIAFAADIDTEWWWPDMHGHGAWPITRREETMECFQQAFESLGYEICADGFEAGFEKIVIYELHGIPTHAAKQLPDGRWKSKLGPAEDIEHNTTTAVGGSGYGQPKLFMRRRIVGF